MFRYCLFLCLVLMQSWASSWPEFRGPTGQGAAPAKNIPVHWTATSNVVWKVSIPGRGWSSPVIADGRIYLTSALQDDAGVSLHVLCLDEGKGTVVWDAEVLQAGSGAAKQIHNKNSLASPTPVVHEGRIYAHFGHMGTAALDLEGKVLWRQTSIKFPPVHGNGGSPVIVDGLLVFSCDGAADPFLAALDLKSGEIRWKAPRKTVARNKFSFCTPLVVSLNGQEVIISPASGFVGAYAPQDGKELWRVRYGEGYSVVPRPVFENGLLYLSSGFDRAVLYAIDPTNATGDVTDTHIRWKQAKGAPNTPSVLAIGSEVYMVSDAGIASCLDAKTSEVHWSERLGGNFSASPVTNGEQIYFVNESGVTSVVRAATTFELLARNDLEEKTLASPALADGAIFVRTESHLWRLGR